MTDQLGEIEPARENEMTPGRKFRKNGRNRFIERAERRNFTKALAVRRITYDAAVLSVVGKIVEILSGKDDVLRHAGKFRVFARESDAFSSTS